MLIPLIMGLSVSNTYADAVPENSMKSAFIYNFALYTEWPDNSISELKLCLLNNEPLIDALDNLSGKTIDGKLLRISIENEDDDFSQCRILFIGWVPDTIGQKVLQKVSNYSTLIITDNPRLKSLGTTIFMQLNGQNRLVFEVNLKSANKAGLSLSSKLLRLAKNIY